MVWWHVDRLHNVPNALIFFPWQHICLLWVCVCVLCIVLPSICFRIMCSRLISCSFNVVITFFDCKYCVDVADTWVYFTDPCRYILFLPPLHTHATYYAIHHTPFALLCTLLIKNIYPNYFYAYLFVGYHFPISNGVQNVQSCMRIEWRLKENKKNESTATNNKW